VKLTTHLNLVLRLRMPHHKVVSQVRKNFAFLASALYLIYAYKNKTIITSRGTSRSRAGVRIKYNLLAVNKIFFKFSEVYKVLT
jgi:hypothetical protein